MGFPHVILLLELLGPFLAVIALAPRPLRSLSQPLAY